MLLRRIFVALVLEHLQRVNQFLARLLRTNHSVDVAALGGNVRAGKAVAKFFNLFIARLGNDLSFFFLRFRRERRALQFALVNNVDRAFRLPSRRSLPWARHNSRRYGCAWMT